VINAKKHLGGLYRTEPRKREGYLRLDMNESPAGLPGAFIRRSLAAAGSDFVAMYPEYGRLIGAIARHNRIAKENICLSNGSDAAIKYIFDAYISAGDRVLLTNPTFAMYPIYCRIFNARPVLIPYNRDLSFPLKDFMNAISPKIKMAVLVNPNNPTGSVLKREELLKIIRKAKACNVLLLADEAYFYFYSGTMIRDIKKFDNLVVTRSFSKLCASASARVGYAAAHKNIIENLRRVKPTYDVNSFGVLLAQELLERPRLLEGLIERTKAGKDFIISRLKASGIKYIFGKANFILIRSPQDPEVLMKKLEKKKILVGGGFRQPFLKDYIRITIGEKKQMKAFWDAFSSICCERKPKGKR